MARLVELDALLNLNERGLEEKQELNQEMQKSSDKEEKKKVDRVETEKEEKEPNIPGEKNNIVINESAEIPEETADHVAENPAIYQEHKRMTLSDLKAIQRDMANRTKAILHSAKREGHSR